MGMSTELLKVSHLSSVYVWMDTIKSVNRQDIKSFGMVFIRKKNNKGCPSTGNSMSKFRVQCPTTGVRIAV